jgi:hypothetical protein
MTHVESPETKWACDCLVSRGVCSPGFDNSQDQDLWKSACEYSSWFSASGIFSSVPPITPPPPPSPSPPSVSTLCQCGLVPDQLSPLTPNAEPRTKKVSLSHLCLPWRVFPRAKWFISGSAHISGRMQQAQGQGRNPQDMACGTVVFKLQWVPESSKRLVKIKLFTPLPPPPRWKSVA